MRRSGMRTESPVSADALLSLWSSQDGLLQQYRSIFIAIQAAMLSVAGLMVGYPERSPQFFVITSVALILVPVWVYVCKKRAALTQAAQFMVAKAEAGYPVSHPGHVLRMAQSGNTMWLVGDPFVDQFDPPTRMGTTLFERFVPAVFVGAWLVLGLVQLNALHKAAG